MEHNRFENVNCFDAIHTPVDESIDMVIFDFPYEMTQNAWDQNAFDWKKLFRECWRVLKPCGCILCFSKQLLTARINLSQESAFKFEYIWAKEKGTDSYNAKLKPLADHENISVFCRGKLPYYPIKTKGLPYDKIRYAKKQGGNYGKDSQTQTLTKNPGDRYPKTVLYYPRDHANQGIHPTQKPVALLEYLIKQHSKPGAIIFDPTAGSASTVIACKKTARNYIAFELDPDYFQLAQERIAYFDRYGVDDYSKPEVLDLPANQSFLTTWMGVNPHA